jgi:2-iminobutanoate/2-iminopropanoate deaminase
MAKVIVKTGNAPQAIGPYNQAVIFKGSQLVFTAGQIPLDPETGSVVEGDIEIQTKQTLENLKAVLEAAGTELSKVIKVTVFLKDMKDFPRLNNVYATYFNQNHPARSVVEVSCLPKNVLIEIECISEK